VSPAAQVGAGLALIVFAVPVGVTAPAFNGQTILAVMMIGAGAWICHRARPERATPTPPRAPITYATHRPPKGRTGTVVGEQWFVTKTNPADGLYLVEVWQWSGRKWRQAAGIR
jgi:hypothetical protein